MKPASVKKNGIKMTTDTNKLLDYLIKTYSKAFQSFAVWGDYVMLLTSRRDKSIYITISPNGEKVCTVEYYDHQRTRSVILKWIMMTRNGNLSSGTSIEELLLLSPWYKNLLGRPQDKVDMGDGKKLDYVLTTENWKEMEDSIRTILNYLKKEWNNLSDN